MSMTRTLVRMYPASFRERWGPMLEADARSAGWRSWPSLAATAIDMWLHLVVWPAESASQRRHRATAMALTVAVVIGVVGRAAAAAAANGSPLAQQAHRVWTLTDCGPLIVLGMPLVLPLPRLTRHAVATMLRRAAQALAAPLILGAGSLTLVHSARIAVMSQTRLLVAD